MALDTGARLGRYEVLGLIGAGGMGEVYRARDTRLGRTVALKVLPPQLAADPVRRERFEREARAASALEHPHICALHDIGAEGGVSFLSSSTSRARHWRRASPGAGCRERRPCASAARSRTPSTPRTGRGSSTAT